MGVPRAQPHINSIALQYNAAMDRSRRSTLDIPLRFLLALFSASQLCISPSRSEVTCSTLITVDRSASTAVDCSLLTDSLANTTCSNLEDVLLSLAHNQTVSGDCIELSVLQGDYVVREFIAISQNLKLHGEGNVTVHFNFTDKFDPSMTRDPRYILSFFNAEYFEMSGIDFTQSPGIITVFSVASVVITNCSFR